MGYVNNRVAVVKVADEKATSVRSELRNVILNDDVYLSEDLKELLFDLYQKLGKTGPNA